MVKLDPSEVDVSSRDTTWLDVRITPVRSSYPDEREDGKSNVDPQMYPDVTDPAGPARTRLHRLITAARNTYIRALALSYLDPASGRAWKQKERCNLCRMVFLN